MTLNNKRNEKKIKNFHTNINMKDSLLKMI